jgi:hypothetical protein
MKTAACYEATEKLLAYFENPDLHQVEVDTAIQHISECSHCEDKVGHLVRALSANEEDTLTCRECQDNLPDYLLAETEGQAAGARWRAVARHLEMCPHCSTAYATMADLTVLAYGEQGAEPPVFPEPDFSFLHPETAKIPWHLNELKHLVIELSTELLEALPPPAPAVVGLKSHQSPQRVLCEFSLEEVENIVVKVTAEEKRNDPTHCTVSVTVDIPSRGGWPNLTGTLVTLKKDQQDLTSQLTDAFGQAVFEDIVTDDLAHLAFEIAPSE